MFYPGYISEETFEICYVSSHLPLHLLLLSTLKPEKVTLWSCPSAKAFLSKAIHGVLASAPKPELSMLQNVGLLIKSSYRGLLTSDYMFVRLSAEAAATLATRMKIKRLINARAAGHKTITSCAKKKSAPCTQLGALQLGDYRSFMSSLQTSSIDRHRRQRAGHEAEPDCWPVLVQPAHWGRGMSLFPWIKSRMALLLHESCQWHCHPDRAIINWSNNEM